MRAWLGAVVAAAATALMLALYARFEWPWLLLGWIALVPWLAALDRATSLGRAFAAGLLMSEAFVLAVFGWFASAVQTYTGLPWLLALLVLVVLAPFLQAQFVTFSLTRYLARRAAAGVWRTTLAGASAYVGTEWASAKLFGDTLGYGLYPSVWMRQAADLAGAHGLTFVLLVANECGLALARAAAVRAPAEARRRAALAPAACIAVLVLALGAYGALRHRALTGSRGRDRPVTAAVVQGDIAHYERLRAEIGAYDAVRTILDAYLALSAEALGRADLDLVVWPETVYPTTFGTPKSDEGAAFDRRIGAFVAEAGVPLVFGAYDAEGGKEFNAAVFLEPAAPGRLGFETYRKASLFPLTERVPAVLERLGLRRWLPWLGSWKAGAGPEAIGLALAGGRRLRVAPLICYEVLDPGHVLAAVRRGAELIVTLSNDSWFAEGPGPRLHLVGAAFRSIETRRPQLRATNTGISAVIAPTGDLVAAAAVHERATLVETVVPDAEATTLMLAWGDWFGPTALVCGVLLAASLLTRRR